MKTTLFLRHLLLFGLILIQFPSCLESLDADEDPYKILGVPRSASNDDIKKAYKKMARNWHPDKNDDPEAQEMFIKINEAHEILSDKEKKQHFDLYGTTTQPRNGQKQGSPFFDPHSGFSFFFNGMPFQNSWSRPGQIDYRTYYKTILPMSSEKPYLIKFIADWCFACAQIEEIWEDTTHGMKKNGMGIGIVNINSSPRLADALGIRHVPSIIGVINGYISFYSGSVTKRRLKDFVTGLFPGGLIQMVTKQNLDSFLDTSGTNKPGVVLFSQKLLPSLLYQLVAFSSHKQQSFGFVSLKDSSAESIRKRFHANSEETTVMIFKDDAAAPDVVVTASELKSGKLREVVESHKYLYLPRLSSRSLFHDLCPEERFRSQRRLCVVLFTKQGQHEKEKLILRLLAKDKKYQNEQRIQFLYLYEDVQKEFIINGFKDGMKEDTCADNSTAPKVVIIWNKGKKEIRYDWLRTGWCVSDGELSLTKARLVVMLNDLLSGEGKLRYTSRLPFIHNEHAPGLLSLLLTWCNDAFYYVRSSMYRKEAISLVSLLFGLGIILFFNAFVPSASESLDRVHKTSKKSHSPPPQSNTVLGVVRLDPSNEHSLVSEAPPGHMTFALLVDEESVQEAVNSPLIQAFSDVVNPYKGNPNLTFAWLTIADNLAWCSEVMSVDKFGEVTPGIVLALNGHKKYLSIFKPSDLTKSAFFKRQGGDLMGFDNSDSETESISDPQREYELKRQKVLSVSLRRQFVIWLEKLLDGLVDRTKIEEWPRFTD
ncbi:dnaJ homolog subfamily C member 16-like [Montipora capricornis]|uniref:dnaJ homolog subfamily C member 16-like n=1 Tax=Montipora capricornis TaxID=246305 RepID=UPI0035F1E7C3